YCAHRDLHSFPTRRSSDLRTIRTVTSDGNAQYSIRLAAGEWFASGRFYDGTTLYATLGRVVVAPRHRDLQPDVRRRRPRRRPSRSEEHTSELQSRFDLVCR